MPTFASTSWPTFAVTAVPLPPPIETPTNTTVAFEVALPVAVALSDAA